MKRRHGPGDDTAPIVAGEIDLAIRGEVRCDGFDVGDQMSQCVCLDARRD
jgi:hypothetical protein